MIASFLEGIEHSLDDKHISSLADRLPGWSGSDIQVYLCLPEIVDLPQRVQTCARSLENCNKFGSQNLVTFPSYFAP